MNNQFTAPLSRGLHAPAPAASQLQKLIGDAPFISGTPAPCHIPVHDMGCFDKYHPLLKVYEEGSVVRSVPAYDRIPKYKTNRKLKDGDFVQLVEHAEVSGYVYDEGTGQRSWTNHIVLAGSTGTVVSARTPWVLAPRDGNYYFANVDIHMPDGSLSRVRVAHTALRVLQSAALQ